MECGCTVEGKAIRYCRNHEIAPGLLVEMLGYVPDEAGETALYEELKQALPQFSWALRDAVGRTLAKMEGHRLRQQQRRER